MPISLPLINLGADWGGTLCSPSHHDDPHCPRHTHTHNLTHSKHKILQYTQSHTHTHTLLHAPNTIHQHTQSLTHTHTQRHTCTNTTFGPRQPFIKLMTVQHGLLFWGTWGFGDVAPWQR